MKNKVIMYTMWLFFIYTVLFMIKKKPIEDNIYKYIEFNKIPKNEGVYSWLPDFFPTTSRDIEIFTDVESDSFYSNFSLDENSSKLFEETLKIKASVDGIKYLNKVNTINAWCKESDSIDDKNKDLYKSLYLIAKFPENKYHILLVKRGENKLEAQRNCAPL